MSYTSGLDSTFSNLFSALSAAYRNPLAVLAFQSPQSTYYNQNILNLRSLSYDDLVRSGQPGSATAGRASSSAGASSGEIAKLKKEISDLRDQIRKLTGQSSTGSQSAETYIDKHFGYATTGYKIEATTAHAREPGHTGSSKKNGSELVFRVSRSARTDVAETLDYRLLPKYSQTSLDDFRPVTVNDDGTLSRGSPVLPAGSVHFRKGQTEASITVTVGNDYVREDGEEALSIGIFNRLSGTLLSHAEGFVRDADEAAPTKVSVSLSAAAATGGTLMADQDSVREGGVIAPMFTFNGPLDENVVVEWEIVPKNTFMLDRLTDSGGMVPAGRTFTTTVNAHTNLHTPTLLTIANNAVANAADDAFEIRITMVTLADATMDALTLDTSDTATAMVVDRDAEFAIAANSPRDFSEGDVGQTFIPVVVTRSSGHGSGEVDWEVMPGGTAIFSTGTVTMGTVMFAEGETAATISLSVDGNTVATTTNTPALFEVHLSNARQAGGLETATIATTMTSTTPAASIPGAEFRIHEDDGLTTLRALTAPGLGDGEAEKAPFSYRVSGQAGDDVTLTVMAAGGVDLSTRFDMGGWMATATDTWTLNLMLDASGDGRADLKSLNAGGGDLDFTVALTSAMSATGGARAVDTRDGEIAQMLLHDDSLIMFAPALQSPSVDEGTGGSGTVLMYHVVREAVGGATLAGDATVQYTIMNTGSGTSFDAADLTGGSGLTGTLTFARKAGATSQTLTLNVTVAADTVAEDLEQFEISLHTAGGDAVIAGSMTAYGAIRNDD